MTSDPIHPELQKIARWVPQELSGGPKVVRLGQLLGPVTALPRRRKGAEIVNLPGGKMRVRRPAPNGTKRPGVLWIHGGGYIGGTAMQDDPMCVQLSQELDAVVAGVEYRVAPQHPYPAAIDDCYAGLRWLAAQPDVDPSRIAIAGASAGGGLAAALTLRAVDAGEVMPVCQILVYPMLDDRTALDGTTDVPHKGWGPRSNDIGWTSYLGAPRGSDDVSPYAVPARRKDLSALPPTWLGVGTHDLFCAETIEYAKRLTDAGVPTTLEVVPGAFHGFDVLAAKSSVARAFLASQLGVLRPALGVVAR